MSLKHKDLQVEEVDLEYEGEIMKIHSFIFLMVGNKNEWDIKVPEGQYLVNYVSGAVEIKNAQD